MSDAPVTLYLRFPDRAAALDALRPLGLTTVDRDGAEVFAPDGVVDGTRVDLDVVFGTGEIAAPTADGSGSASQPGFHLDLLWWGPTPPDFGAARITPATPPCVFALA